ncbi:MAG: acyl carrier protein [Bacteroidetes bacterium]|nr:acyl carrier protein [Bacteroidota bacterium]
MSLEEFTKNLEQELEEIEPGTLTPETNYRDLKSWSSMYALIIIAFVDYHFNIQLNGNELKSTETVKDLYELVKQKGA